jgi:hypothetical protein
MQHLYLRKTLHKVLGHSLFHSNRHRAVRVDCHGTVQHVSECVVYLASHVHHAVVLLGLEHGKLLRVSLRHFDHRVHAEGWSHNLHVNSLGDVQILVVIARPLCSCSPPCSVPAPHRGGARCWH